MNNIIITGANGFIGSHLVDKLSKNNNVYAVDRFSRKPQYIHNKNITKVKIDLYNNIGFEALLRKIKEPYIFEFINNQTPTSSFNNFLFETIYIKSVLERLNLYVKYRIKRVIFPSSAGTIYQITNDKNIYSEEDSVSPSCPYGLSKYNIEKYLEYYHQKYNLDYLSFRISSVYGPRQSINKDQGVIIKFLYSIVKNNQIELFGSVNSERDFIYIDDVANIISRIYNKKHKHFLYNLGSGKLTSLSDLIIIIKQIVNSPFQIIKSKKRLGDNQKVGISIKRLTREFNIMPVNNLEPNIRRTYKYIISSVLKK